METKVATKFVLYKSQVERHGHSEVVHTHVRQLNAHKRRNIVDEDRHQDTRKYFISTKCSCSLKPSPSAVTATVPRLTITTWRN